MDQALEFLQRGWRRPPFEVKLALLVLFLSLLYAATFSRLVHISLLEQVVQPSFNLPRYAQPAHTHNGIEWFLLVFPAVTGWIGVLGAVISLTRRLVRLQAEPRED